jgi:hypothetical protein
MLCDMIYWAFVEMRALAWSGRAQQAADLADAFHNISKEMNGWGCFTWADFEGRLSRYQATWRTDDLAKEPDYSSMLAEVRRAV